MRTHGHSSGRTFVLTALLLGATATVWLQQPPRPNQTPPPAAPEGQGEASELVLKTQFLEVYKGGKWDEARASFIQLSRAFPVVHQDKRLVYLYADAQYRLNLPQDAKQTLTSLLQLQGDHVRGLFLLAQIEAKSSNTTEMGLAKDHLILAAKAGLYVLRDINSDDGKKTFAYLLTDPQFILRVMNAANEHQLSSSEIPNPFASPLLKGDVEPGGEPNLPSIIDPRAAELEQRIEDLFKEIVRLAEEREVEELIIKFQELRTIMTEYQGLGTAEVKKKLEKWGQRLNDLGEVKLSIQLQVFISEGNQHLRAMADAIRADQYDVALDRFTQIEALCELMRAEEREVFHRNAEALFLRGKALADRARRLKRISEFRLIVTGVVVAPPDGKEPDRAIINDRIYTEGDTMVDETSDEEIEGLRVVEIVRSTVRFRYEDTEFVRELKPQQ